MFPFSTLHPNVGACLRVELRILLDILLNPSMSFGEALIHDQHCDSPNPTDAGLSSRVCSQAAGKNPDENDAGSGEEGGAALYHFMCRGTGSSTGAQADLPDAGGQPAAASSLGSPWSSSHMGLAPTFFPGAGDSAPNADALVSLEGGVASHRDPHWGT